uniref:OBG-type G domain-containing protein n=1 Tax=Amphora coffeiformis TaxID=265554 RepID=A0A7S3LHY3_9STRA
MADIQAKINELEAEMARTQKNKATNYHLGTLKAKIAKLKSELVNGPGGKSAGSKDAGRGFDVTKSGDTRIGLVGFPSVGKSTLLTTLTGTRSEAAAYEFTTLTCIPGTMKYRGAKIQVLDLPGIIEGAADGRGRGRQVISTARTCNLILVVLDSGKPVTHKKIIEQELFSFGIRINQGPPDVKIVTKQSGGIGYQEVAKQTKGMNAEVARLVCKEYKISCAEIILREDITVDQFIDVIEGKYVEHEMQLNRRRVFVFVSLVDRIFLTAFLIFNTAARIFPSCTCLTKLIPLPLKNSTFWIACPIMFPLAVNTNGIWKN